MAMRARPKLRLPLILGAAGGFGAVIVAITAFAVLVSTAPPQRLCHFACLRPQPGSPLASPAEYRNPRFGYTVGYLPQFAGQSEQLVDANADGVTVEMQDGAAVVFSATSGSNVNAAVVQAFNSINTARFQQLQPIGAVRGAEVGLVLGSGFVYRGDYVPPSGAQGVPVALLVMAATLNGLTIDVVAYGPYTKDPHEAPYGFQDGTLLDYPITMARFPGA